MKSAAANVAMILVLIFFPWRTASARDDSFTCKQYLALSETSRSFYVVGILEGYSIATQMLNTFAESEQDKKLGTELAFNVTVLAKLIAKTVGKLTVGATVKMLDAECAKSPNKHAGSAFVDVMMRLN